MTVDPKGSQIVVSAWAGVVATRSVVRVARAVRSALNRAWTVRRRRGEDRIRGLLSEGDRIRQKSFCVEFD
ncbi:hypothetical protein [Streptomyces sp. Wb2n-11]|uniref:hypothetical protein n=1 Tax=Streptomyces sp. Wb2n-11 TaxID=1030533 RepID=UPI00159ED5F5